MSKTHENLNSDKITNVETVQTLRRFAASACSVEAAVDRSLDILGAAGYSRSMLSLAFDDGDDKWMIAHSARGENWEKVILPTTRRKLGENDILAIVAETASPKYIADAQADPHCYCADNLFRESEVISFYAIPLLDEFDQAIGVLQVDLGDMKDTPELPSEMAMRLDLLGAMVAVQVNQAIQSEELRLVRRLDQILSECLNLPTTEDAIRHFVKQVAQHLQVAIHIRIRQRDGTLQLVDGIGSYYEASRELRPAIAATEQDRLLSAAVNVIETNRPVVVNDAHSDERHTAKIQKYADTALAASLVQIRSYADFPIGEPSKPCIGTVSLSSNRAWFFTQSKLRSLNDIGHRLSILVGHLRQKEEKEKSLAQLTFLREIAPPLERQLNVCASLNSQAMRIASAAQADAVSCYLWSDLQSRFVLRAQHGWADARWIDAAWYAEREGLTGEFAMSSEPTYVPDLNLYRDTHSQLHDKYIDRIFADYRRDQDSCEFVALPLHFKRRTIGVVTLHRRHQHQFNGDSRFTTTDPGLLKEASEIMSAYVAALADYDSVRWKAMELQQRQRVLDVLVDPTPKPLQVRLTGFCEAVVEQYRFTHCIIYLTSQERTLDVCAEAVRESPVKPDSADPLLQVAFDSGQVQTVRSPHAAQQNSPDLVRRENVIERMLVPMGVDGRIIGVLDLRWKGIRPLASEILPHHDPDCLCELAARVAESIRTYELQRIASRSQAALDGIAHFLRDNFHNLARSVQELKSDIDSVSDHGVSPDQQTAIERLKIVAHKQSRIFNQVKTASQRIVEPRRRSHEITEILDDAISSCRDSIARNGTIIRCDVAPFFAWVDRGQIRECFKSIIENAINAMPTGGTLTIALRPIPEEHVWIFEATDTGPGIRLDRQKRPVQDREGTSRGGGVGLFLSRLYCESHNGQLRFESEACVGTKVTVRIPLAEPGREVAGI